MCRFLGRLILILTIVVAGPSAAQDASRPTLRAGMIGLDTSHVPAFTKLFNNPQASGDVAGIRIVAGYPGGTDLDLSKTRVQKFTEEIRVMGVEIVNTIPELLKKVDVVLLESVDGRIHLREAIPVIEAGKPLFIDKPLAGSLADAIAIYDLAKKHNVPVFSSSSSRFSPGIQELTKSEKVGDVAGAATWGPCTYQSGVPDMFFYGIHGIEALYTIMGPGCESVQRIRTPDTDLVSGVWQGGRVGSFRGIRYKTESGAMAFGSKGVVTAERGGGYEHLCQAIGKFFRTKTPPVAAETTIEMFAFMEAADESQRRGGQLVSIAEIMKTAQSQAPARLAEARK